MKMLLHINTKDAIAFYKGEATKAYAEIYKPYDSVTVSIDENDELHPNVNDGCFIIKRGPKTIELLTAEKDVVGVEQAIRSERTDDLV